MSYDQHWRERARSRRLQDELAELDRRAAAPLARCERCGIAADVSPIIRSGGESFCYECA